MDRGSCSVTLEEQRARLKPYFYLEPMHLEDVPEVSQLDHRCFTNPWPQSAYRRELARPEDNFYIVLRQKLPGDKATVSLRGSSRKSLEDSR
jgi:hypothetical protein